MNAFEGARKRYYIVLLLLSLCLCIMLVPVYLLFRNWGSFLDSLPLLALILFGMVTSIFSMIQLLRHRTESAKQSRSFPKWLRLSMILVVLSAILLASSMFSHDYVASVILLGFFFGVIGILGTCYGMLTQACQEKERKEGVKH
jgi:NADH:ubiquinone oxidoreductase subunit 4 (subunit M)